jgi:radical SAM protein with 4Fe4S-binding SPASM domain
MTTQRIISYRYESFGGILHLKNPSALVYVDKDYMLSLGYSPSPLWDRETRLLSAPTEVHLSITRHCTAGCGDCYMDARDLSPTMDAAGTAAGEIGLPGMKRAIDALAAMRVFHVALGGGESFEIPWLMDLVRHVRSRGIVPNITTNGRFISEANVFQCQNFGRINVSLRDVGPFGPGESAPRRAFEAAHRALDLLRKAGVPVGINCVVTRDNVDRLEEIVRYARRMRAREIEFLRLKPAGRAREGYAEQALTRRQAREFFPRVMALMKRHGVTLKLDCSFTPLLCSHAPDPERMEFFSIAGCDGGNLLVGAAPDGRVAPCSFSRWEDLRVEDLPDRWTRPETFEPYRRWTLFAAEPCASCAYLRICRGGCHAVSEYYYGDPRLPDPECPIVAGHAPLVH